MRQEEKVEKASKLHGEACRRYVEVESVWSGVSGGEAKTVGGRGRKVVARRDAKLAPGRPCAPGQHMRIKCGESI